MYLYLQLGQNALFCDIRHVWLYGGGHFNVDATAHCAIRVMKLHTLSPILSLQYLVMWVSTTDCLTIRLIEHGQLNVAARMLPKISLFPGPCTQYRLCKWPGTDMDYDVSAAPS